MEAWARNVSQIAAAGSANQTTLVEERCGEELLAALNNLVQAGPSEVVSRVDYVARQTLADPSVAALC
jgi:hypothetical protein